MLHCVITMKIETLIKNSINIKNAIRSKYAWPGGYPLFLICSDGAALCCDCGRKQYRQIAYSIMHKLNDGWRVVASDINWEDQDLTCDHCGKQIESAYGDNPRICQVETTGEERE